MNKTPRKIRKIENFVDLVHECINKEIKYGSISFAHVAIDHNHSQQPVPKNFPLFKRCEWLVVNCNVSKRAPLLFAPTIP